MTLFLFLLTRVSLQSYGVFLSFYLESARFPSASSLDYALIGGFNFAFAMLAAPLATILTRKFGKHLTMPIGAALQTTGYVTAGFTTRIWQLFVAQGVLVGLGVGFVYIPSLPILSQWFDVRRSLANGISSAGSGVGGALFTWSIGIIIRTLSVRWALCITAIITFGLTAIATAIVRDRNKYIRPPQLAFDTTLLMRYDVQLLLAWAFVSMLGYIALLFSLSDFALAIGLSTQQATDTIGLLNVGTAIGRPVIGVLSDRSSRWIVAGALTLVCALLSFALWIPAQSFMLLAVFAVLAGAVLGVFWMVRLVITPSERVAHYSVHKHRLSARYASRSQGSSISSHCFLYRGSRSFSLLLVSPSPATPVACPSNDVHPVSEVIALKLRRPNSERSYLYPQLFVGLSYLVASGLMCELNRFKRRERWNRRQLSGDESIEFSGT